ncbi:MAG: SMI1/KNR4 family protein [Eubacterium sp.]|nr:SMI1/KNR4 family protein [Eubacterium sp.]
MLISKFQTETGIHDELMRISNKYNLLIEHKYIYFLEKYNGGETPKTEYIFKRKKYDIRCFFGFDCERVMYDFRFILNESDIIIMLKDKLFPIACNYFGDYYYLDCRNDLYNSVFLCYHDSDNKALIADSFESFIANCKSKKIGHIRSIEERINDMKKKGLEDKITETSIECWQAEIDKYSHIKQEIVSL